MSIERLVRIAQLRIRSILHRADVERELDEELRYHIERQIAENVRRGMSPDAARTAALKSFGGLEYQKEQARDRRGTRWLEELVSDLRFSVRTLRRAPGFASAVVLALGLGIGANTAIFSVVRGVLLKPLPNRNGDRLVYMRQSMDGIGGEDILFSVPEVRDFRTGVPSLAGIAEYSSNTMIQRSSEGSVRWNVGLVTGNYFEVMGLSPILGRLTRPTVDDGPAASRVAVLTYECWVNRFGSDSSIVGKNISLNQQPVTVIGVLEPAPFFPDRVDAIVNLVNSEHHLSASMQQKRTHRMTQVVARMTPNATLEQTRTEVAAVYARMQRQNKEAYNTALHYRVAVMPFRDVLGERARFTLWLLMGAAALVLIIAVANVANLTLMRGVRREHELVVRAALGAGTLRLKRLILVENLLLAFLGAALGTVIALGGVKPLASLAARYSPRSSEIELDAIVLGFAVTLSAVVALVLSLLAWTPIEERFASVIGGGTRRLTGSKSTQRLQRSLVVAQVAISVVLLTGAGLLTRTLTRLSEVDTGLRADKVLTMQVTLLSRNDGANHTAAAEARQRFDDMRREIAALPGVTTVGIGSTLPLRTAGAVMDLDVEGRPLSPGESAPRADWRGADPNYFKAAGIPVLQGRTFATTDTPNEDSVAVINKTLADRLFPNANPIGRRIAFAGIVRALYPDLAKMRTIVGVVGNTRDGELESEPQPVVFAAVLSGFTSGGLVIRTAGDPSALTAAATRVVRRIAPTALIENVMTIQQFKDRSISPKRLNAMLISSFGALALALAAVGIAGVLAFSVSARTNEIGIRMSLGADEARVERMILGEGGSLVIIGLVLGVSGALLAGRAIQGLLFGIAPNDPVTLVAAVVVMAVIGMVACWIPALRAARVDPLIAMRAQ